MLIATVPFVSLNCVVEVDSSISLETKTGFVARNLVSKVEFV
ncbi:hypothetical protein JCM19240_5978 [Vibrio maritimus]|uniref:Uncharacterized protein n=1 Tax=Vibrio maritimus TaxID=990268 RepID=A0A090SY04_9VIBR|nr:hypothetical protein JCM19240_5978 [Vibrio maritimus]